MATQDQTQLIHDLLEGLDEFQLEYFFPYDRTLYEDIKNILQEKEPEEIEKYQKFFHFPLEIKKQDEGFPEDLQELLEEAEKTSQEEEQEIQKDKSSEKEPESEISETATPETTIPESTTTEETSLDDSTEPELSLETPVDEGEDIENIDTAGLSGVDSTPTETTSGEEIGLDSQEMEMPDFSLDTTSDGSLDLEGMGDVSLGSEDMNLQDTISTEISEEIPQTSIDQEISDINLEESTTVPDLDLTEPKTEETAKDSATDIEMPDLEASDTQIPDLEFSEAPKDVEPQSVEEESIPSDHTQMDFESETSLPDGDLDLGISEDELQEMQKQSLLSEGIGKELTEEELAKLRASLVSYSEPVRKAIIDAIVNEKISRPEQRLLINMLVDEAEESSILDFIEEKLGYRPRVSEEKTKEGIPIIYVDEVSPEALRRRKRRTLFFLFGISGLFLGIVAFLVGVRVLNYFRTKGFYEKGLEELQKAQNVSLKERDVMVQKAEEYFQKALENEGRYNIYYLNQYGLAYIKIGKYDKAFEKLFGKIEPDYAWNSKALRVPLIRKATPWRSLQEIRKGYYTEFFSRDQIKRKLLIPGAYTVSRLRDETFQKDNLILLAKFHSLNIPYFLNSEEGKKYKNDQLAIEYYRIILTLMDEPDNSEAISGIGKIYYNQKKYSLAATEYQKIVDHNPEDIKGHDGILNTYIELWKTNQDPRYVIAKHRYLQQLGLEEDLPIYTLTKLAGFYIDIEPKELRIRYGVDPVNSLNQLDIKGVIRHLLDIIFHKTEKREQEVIEGNKYGEGFYQRGRFYYNQKQFKNGVRQFQNAYYFDPKHFPAVLYIGRYYLYNLRDYEKAKEYFLKSLSIYLKDKDFYGIRPEDETLISFDKGLLYYDLSSIVFEKYKDSLIPSIVSLKEPTNQYQNILKEFSSSEVYIEKAISLLKDQDKLTSSLFRKGFVEYINGDFDQAFISWLKIDDKEKFYRSPNYYLALGNVSFYKEQYNQALYYFIQAKEILEGQEKLSDLQKRILYSVYNNMGATYESLYDENQKSLPRYKQEELQTTAMEYYYKAMEFATKNQILPVKAKMNISLAFQRDKSQIQFRDELLPKLFFTK